MQRSEERQGCACPWPVLGLRGLSLPRPWPSRGAIRVNPTHTPRSKEEGEAPVPAEGSVRGSPLLSLHLGCRYQARGRQEARQPALEPWAWVLKEAGSRGALPTPARAPGWGSLESRSLGISALYGGLTTPHPSPQASQVSAPGRQGAWRAWAPGHHQHRISFHLCKDWLTPEHINILNDSERNWDSSRSAPPSASLRPLPSLLTLPLLSSLPLSPLPAFSLTPLCLPPSLFPLSLFWYLSSLLSCLSLCLPPLPSSPLLFLSPPSTGPHSPCAFTDFHPTALGGSPAGPVPLSVCPSPAGPRCPMLGGSQCLETGPTW